MDSVSFGYRSIVEIDIPSSNVRIDHFRSKPEGSNRVFITFTERTNRLIEGVGFGGRFLLDHGYDVVAVKTDSDTWYTRLGDQGLSLIRALLEPYTHRTTYGSSMGGFAAIKHAGTLGAQNAVALSPIQDIRYDWDNRHHQDIEQCRFPHGSQTGDMIVHQDISERCHYHIAYDPYCYEDRRHKDILCSIIATPSFMTIPFSGHPVGPSMLAAGILKDYVLACAEQRPYPKYMRRRGLKVTELYTFSHFLLMKRRLGMAMIVSNRLAEKSENSPEALALHANILGESGFLDQAEAFITRAAALSPENIHIAGYAVQVQIMLRNFDNAEVMLLDLEKVHGENKVSSDLRHLFRAERQAFLSEIPKCPMDGSGPLS